MLPWFPPVHFFYAFIFHSFSTATSSNINLVYQDPAFLDFSPSRPKSRCAFDAPARQNAHETYWKVINQAWKGIRKSFPGPHGWANTFRYIRKKTSTQRASCDESFQRVSLLRRNFCNFSFQYYEYLSKPRKWNWIFFNGKYKFSFQIYNISNSSLIISTLVCY